jgi:predicted transcriptional regulator
VDSFAIGRGAESEVELDCGHCAFSRVGLGLVGLSSMAEDPKRLKSTL